MNENLKYRDVNLINKKPHKNAKPYWDNILNDLWNIMKQKEKQFRQIKNDSSRRKLCLSEFMHARANFDINPYEKKRKFIIVKNSYFLKTCLFQIQGNFGEK